MKVLKFGGASADYPQEIRSLVEIVRRSNEKLIVVSAVSGVTDDLIRAGKAAERQEDYSGLLSSLREKHCGIARAFLPAERADPLVALVERRLQELGELLGGVRLLKDLSRRTLDQIMSFGEVLAAELIASILEAQGIPAEAIDARELVKTDASYGSAHWIEGETRKRVGQRLSGISHVAVVTGFIGSTMEGATTTLGRGGSDITAGILAACLGAEEIQLWTDQDGMLSAEPELVSDTIVIEEISYDEALEMMHFGAKGLRLTSFQPAMNAGIPLHMLNLLHPEGKGTLIVRHARESSYPVRGLASIPSISLLTIHGLGLPGVTGIAGRMFSALARAQVNVILITQASSELSICCAVSPESAGKGAAALHSEFSPEIAAGLIDTPVVESDMSVIAIVGEEMKRRTGISGRVFSALGRNGVNVTAIAQGSSELNISVVVDSKDRAKAIATIHDAFFLAGIRTVNLFLAGTGLIGGTLLAQIARQRGKLLEEHSIRINLLGLANQRSMVVDPAGIDVVNWKERLASGEPADLPRFIEKMKCLNLPSVCFCDCSASETLPGHYEDILVSSISIVTPNKRGNAGPLDRYRRLKELVREKDLVYGYETTVGAGLPVIGTLHDLVACGDTISSIEAVLSGTLSYIFNELGSGKRRFSELVLDAKAKGYTEPDPRDDLGAVDVARKMLILMREAGINLNYEDIQIQPLLTDKIARADRVDSFLEMLPEMDAYYDGLVSAAASRGKVLRYVASIRPDSAVLRLKEYSPDSPFYNLNGTDNLVMFSTARYSSNPLVIRGPGAGAEVTAGGVFADILKTAHSYL